MVESQGEYFVINIAKADSNRSKETLDRMVSLYWLLSKVLELVSVFKFVSFWFFLCLQPGEWLWMLDGCNLGWSLHLHNSLGLIRLIHVLVSHIKSLGCIQRYLIESTLLQFVNDIIS